jgi:hypothetical protein
MDIIDKLIVSDVITQSQYYDSRKGQDDDAPLKRLMLAVLRDALACLLSPAYHSDSFAWCQKDSTSAGRRRMRRSAQRA